MTPWQKRARMGVAVFGVAFAAFVYRSIGDRPPPAPPPELDRLDPKATAETTDTVLQQERGSEREFEINWARSLTYADGSARYFTAEITVRRPGGRVVVITANELFAGQNQTQLMLTGEVRLEVDDGFRLQTAEATFDQKESIARVPGAITFGRGLMSGSGQGATYDERNDVLQILEDARVATTNQAGATTLEGRAGTATLDRSQDVLFLNSDVHILRGRQVIDAGDAMAKLSAGEEVVRYLELRGGSKVRGGSGSLDSMSASAIDLDYTDDGIVLERAILNGDASLVTVADARAAARRMSGGMLDVQLAADGSVRDLTGREQVRLELPGSGAAPVRDIRARTLDATGEPGRGLNGVRFRGDVVFHEKAGPEAPAREVRAQSLAAVLDGDTVTNAIFSGGVTFEERGFQASAPDARYQPGAGVLNLAGDPARVRDDHISVDAQAIDVRLTGHSMTANGRVRTVLTSRRSASSAPDIGGSGRLPGLLKAEEATSINADALEYSGANGRAVYTGTAALVQDQTSIRGDTIALDQQRGDLIASGSARSTLMLDGGRTDGRAGEIRYDEASRVVTYSGVVVPPTNGRGPAAARPPAGLGHVVGPDGDLRGERIEVVLGRDSNRVERLEAHNHVTLTQGTRVAAGTRLTYYTGDGRYVMSSSGATPVTLRDGCRETTGRTVTFFKASDRIVVDGDDTSRTETRPCTTPAAR